MRLVPRILCVLLLCLSMQAGTQIVQLEEPLNSRSLFGHVEAISDLGPVEHAVVQLCTPGWKSVLKFTKTDSNGYFKLKSKRANLLYLKISAPGFDQLEIKVHIDKHASQDLTLHLNIAT